MANKVNKSELAKARQAKTTALNKAYRARAARLKELGVLSDKVNARKNITRSTRTKINKFVDVLEGRVAVVKAPKTIREKYADVLEQRGAFLVIPKDRAKEKSKISRGLVEIERPLTAGGMRFGTETEVILPFKLTDMQHLVERLKTDESLDGLKRPGEMFAFRLDGWASKIGFVDAAEMGEYIQERYQHLFKPNQTQKVVKYLSFVKFKNYGSHRVSHGEHTGKVKDKPRKFGKVDAKGRNTGGRGHSTGYRTLEADRLRKQAERARKKAAKGL